jgi:regulator of sigma E protease
MPTLVALLALGVLVLVHELAHLLAARAVGARAVVFSIGLGLPLYGFRGLGQRWVLGAIPWGAWLRLEGENPYEPASGVTFSELSPVRRMLVFLAGPLASLLLGVFLLVGLHAVGTHVPVPMTVGTVEPGSEAARVGLRPGDVLESVGGQPVVRWESLTAALAAHAGQPVTLGLRRASTPLTVSVLPTADTHGQGHVGVAQAYVFAKEPLPRAFAAGLRHAVQLARQTASWTADLFRGSDGALPGAAAVLLRRLAAIESLDGAARALAAASIALGFLYLLPLPALDGGRLLFTLWESLRGRPLEARMQTALQLVSLLLAVAAVGWVALNEVRQALSAAQQR